MKFIQVEPLWPRGAGFRSSSSYKELTYITEGATKVKPGDIVEAKVYETPALHRVLRVGATREAIGSSYRGAVKVIERVVTERERKALERIERAIAALDSAHSTLEKAQAAARKELE